MSPPVGLRTLLFGGRRRSHMLSPYIPKCKSHRGHLFQLLIAIFTTQSILFSPAAYEAAHNYSAPLQQLTLQLVRFCYVVEDPSIRIGTLSINRLPALGASDILIGGKVFCIQIINP